MAQLFDSLRATAIKWRNDSKEHHGGVVLIWQGSVYGWKDRLRDAGHERPGAFAIDEVGHIFIAEGGDQYNVAKCWVAAETASA